MNPLERLKHHVSGAIERGEGTPIVAHFAFTVILKFPDYLNSDFETSVHHCMAPRAFDAKYVAAREAAECYEGANADDFAAIAVFNGHLQDLNT